MSIHKVLIVDDEILTCKLISTMLKLQGYDSVSLTDPALIWDTIASENPTLVIMDYHLGTTDGLDVLIDMKSRAAIQDIPVVITSGMDCHKEATDAGAAGFLIKPFNWQELTAVVEKIVTSNG